MAKILVADDNSNIQKMVGLALKEQGIEVVAVGNGEAAVRKISDIHPDLVLADVFMPVRNGYEVCQYVKSDPALAHIPVILLVGAFDPLDEQEAQRVGADGVLKKPFVPPDPLISMVKSALARAGVPAGGAAPVAPPHEEPIRAAEMLTPRSMPAPVPSPTSFPSMSSQATTPEYPQVESEPGRNGMAERPEPVKIDAGSQPLAFGNLLETAETEPEEELGYATTPRPELERDWKSGEEVDDEVDEEVEETQSSSWRRDAGSEALEDEEVESAQGVQKDWRETAFSEAPARKMRNDSWAPQKETPSFEEAAKTEQRVGAMVKDAPATEAPYTENAWAAALGQKTAVEAATMESPEPAVAAPKEEVAAELPPVNGASSPAKGEPAADPQKAAAESSWFSAVSSPWESEAQKANQLASTWDTPAASEPVESAYSPSPILEAFGEASPEEGHTEVVAPTDDPGATVDTLTPASSDEAKAKMEEAALPAATMEAIREETQQMAETAAQEVPAAEKSGNAPEPSMEDVVAKVLAKMNPEMLQAVTRDILKNVVESMVKDELNAKK
ncbi:MAG: response regulator [Candidatus Acidiferrum sp.]